MPTSSMALPSTRVHSQSASPLSFGDLRSSQDKRGAEGLDDFIFDHYCSPSLLGVLITIRHQRLLHYAVLDIAQPHAPLSRRRVVLSSRLNRAMSRELKQHRHDFKALGSHHYLAIVSSRRSHY
ncbi:hypothetical protein M413DRAFT_25926 [Hebeloma cylindrosporum]|uniref:Uncharacterized protein n=1 Tax=Hebeloma cylindrosporum TaxID=76867 RepID=A0A0C2Y195_HEBCY|nr:hypothetical protein M413DRAFT_25926 [Hebeloma cylindrosporum h7]